MPKGGTDQGGRSDVRQRRALQRLGQDPFGTLGLASGDGVVFDAALGTISIDLATNPGLAFSSGDLTVIVGNGLELTATGIEIDLLASGGLAFSTGDLTIDLRDTTPALELVANGIGVIVGNGLELTASGIEIDLLASGGLAFSTGDLTIDLRDTNPALELTVNGIGVLVGDGLELTASGVAIDLAANPGLAFSTGDLIVTVGAGLELTATGVEIDLATDPGLEFNSGDIRVKIKAAGGITRDSDGLSVTGGGSGTDSGTYSPTITDGANVTSSTLRGVALWTQVGNMVTVFVRVDVVATGTGTDTIINLSLPVALTGTNFNDFFQAPGNMTYHAFPDDGISGVIFSESGAATVRAVFKPSVSGNKGMQLIFSYNTDQS